jgi:hypothetical protein
MNWKLLAVIPSVIIAWTWHHYDSASLPWDPSEYFIAAERIVSGIKEGPLWRAPFVMITERSFHFTSISLLVAPIWALTKDVGLASLLISVLSLLLCNLAIFAFLRLWIRGKELFLSTLLVTTLPLYFAVGLQPFGETLFLASYLASLTLLFSDNPTRKKALISGALLGISATLRPGELIFFSLAIGSIFFYGKKLGVESLTGLLKKMQQQWKFVLLPSIAIAFVWWAPFVKLLLQRASNSIKVSDPAFAELSIVAKLVEIISLQMTVVFSISIWILFALVIFSSRKDKFALRLNLLGALFLAVLVSLILFFGETSDRSNSRLNLIGSVLVSIALLAQLDWHGKFKSKITVLLVTLCTLQIFDLSSLTLGKSTILLTQSQLAKLQYEFSLTPKAKNELVDILFDKTSERVGSENGKGTLLFLPMTKNEPNEVLSVDYPAMALQNLEKKTFRRLRSIFNLNSLVTPDGFNKEQIAGKFDFILVGPIESPKDAYVSGRNLNAGSEIRDAWKAGTLKNIGLSILSDFEVEKEGEKLTYLLLR